MPEEACAFICGILSFCIGILAWYVMVTGEWKCMVISLVFGLIDVGLIASVLYWKYCR